MILDASGIDSHEEIAEESKFEVPFNWGDRLLEFIQEHKAHIDSVYGSLPKDPTGRPIPHQLDQEDAPDVKKLRDVVDALKSCGIDFNFIMNASCTGNTLFTDVGKAGLDRQIKELQDIGIEEVTVANFDLARRISSVDPNMRILMSVILNITEPDQLMYLRKQDFNFSGLVVGKGLNRNLPKLRKFLQLAKDLKTIVIANDFCPVANCPERITDHNNACAHKHLPFDTTLGEQQYVSPSLHCRSVVLQDPTLYLKAPVINPNDIAKYEEVGARLFKLTDRVMPDRVLMQVCEAYFGKRFNGNLFDLFSYTSDLEDSQGSQRLLSPEEVAAILAEGYGSQLANKRHYLANPYTSATDIAASDFMQIFEAGRCGNACFDENHNPHGCSHCSDFAGEYLELDPDAIDIASANVKLIIETSRKRAANQVQGDKHIRLQIDIEDWGETDPLRAAHIRDTHEILRRSQAEHPEKYLIQIDGKDFWVHPGVFPSSYFNDTEFFAKNLPVERGDSLLEIGPGTGIIAISALQRGASEVVGVDISPLAVENSKENAEMYGLTEQTRFLHGDVYEPLDEADRFDKIFWNVPFGYVTKPLTTLEKSVFDTEYAAIERFIKEARLHLKKDGKLLIGTSSVMGDFDRIKSFLSDAGAVEIRLVAEKIQHEGRKQPLTFEIFEVTF